MPYKIFKDGDEFCVYKHDTDGNKVGDTLGCHPTREKAILQLRAVYVNAKESDEGWDPELLHEIHFPRWLGERPKSPVLSEKQPAKPNRPVWTPPRLALRDNAQSSITGKSCTSAIRRTAAMSTGTPRK